MAVAGLQNVSAFGPFFGESTTRTSSVLRMWRELEGDHLVSSPSHRLSQQRNSSNPECNISKNADHTEDHVRASSEMEGEDNDSVVSEQSSDLGERERERVRHIFREWKRSGASSCSSDGPQWLGENERERMILRPSSELATEAADSQTEHHQENRVRRPLRRLCGRQTLVDLLLRAQCERKVELQHLSEQNPVSEFAHRNRIQVLLRGRFLRNERLVPEQRQASVAATELDFLRQRQTVSDLREEFLSKLDNSASTSSNNDESDSSSSREDHKSESVCVDRKVDARVLTTSDSGPVEGTDHNLMLGATQHEDNDQEVPLSQSRDRQATESGVQIHQNEEIELEASFTNERVEREVSTDVESVPSGEEQILREVPIDIEHADSRNSEHIDNVDATNDSLIQTSHVSVVGVPSADFEDITNQEIERQDASPHSDLLQDSETEVQESSGILLTEWTDQEIPETTNAALDHYNDTVQESDQDWQSHDLQEAIDSWLLVPSSLDVGVSFARFHYDHFPDDEATQSMEIRELSSQRRVSSLLRSSFRESLDQVLQSHVERQVDFSYGDMEEEPSSPVLIGQDEERPNVEQSLADGIDANQYDPSSTNITESNQLWDDELNGESLLHASSHRIMGTHEWEIVNELRMDMATLHQRMDHMQSLLEACIDMQIELQRCLRQEVSAALNRTILTRDIAAKEKATDKESQWEHVRKGVCCICAENKINSLLYRCGHMCTCSECAVKLARDNGKCPMCRAPIVEAVRAYFNI